MSFFGFFGFKKVVPMVAPKKDEPRKNPFGDFCPHCYSANTEKYSEYPPLKNADGAVGDLGAQISGLPGPNLRRCKEGNCGKIFEVVKN